MIRFLRSSRSVVLRTLCALGLATVPVATQAQTLVNDLGGVLEYAGAQSVPGGGIVTQVAFAPGDNDHVYVATFGSGILRYDYDPAGATAAQIFTNPVRVVPQSITDRPDGPDGSLCIAFHQDPVLGTVMYFCPSIPFGPFTSPFQERVQQIYRVTDTNGDGTWGGVGDVNQIIVDNLAVTVLHEVNQMQIRGDTLYVGIGTRTQTGGLTAAQHRDFGGTGVNQSTQGETAYSGAVSFIADLTELSNDTTTRNLAGFDIPGIDGVNRVITDDNAASTDIQPFTSTDPGKLRIYATGFRNNYGLGIDDDNEIWVSFNQNENPNRQDALHRRVFFRSHHQFPKANDQIGLWDVVGDETNATLTARNQAVLDAGWFNQANFVNIFEDVGFNVAAGGMDFFPADFAVSNLAGGVLLARNSGNGGVGGNDVIYVDEQNAGVTVVLSNFAAAVEVQRDLVGNYIVGGNNRLGYLRVNDSPAPPPNPNPNPGSGFTLNLSLGEAQGAPAQEVVVGEVWNNLVGGSGAHGNLQFSDATPAPGVTVTTTLVDAGAAGPSPNDVEGIGYISSEFDTITNSLVFSTNNDFFDGIIELITVDIDGLPAGQTVDVEVYMGLDHVVERTQLVSANGVQSPRLGWIQTYNTGAPVRLEGVVVDGQGQIEVRAEAASRPSDERVVIQAIRVILPAPPPSIGQPKSLHFSFGEAASAPGQELVGSDIWNNIVGINNTDPSLSYADGTQATGVSVTTDVVNAGAAGVDPNATGLGYISSTLDTVTGTLIFSDDNNFGDNIDEGITVTVDGLTPGEEYNVDLYFGLNETIPDRVSETRSQEVMVNGVSQGRVNYTDLYFTGAPFTVNGVAANDSGQIIVELSDVTRVTFNQAVVLEASLLQAISLDPVNVAPPPSDNSAFLGSHIVYRGGFFGVPGAAFRYYPFADGALFGGPNDLDPGGDPIELLGGSGLADPSDGQFNITSLPAGTYSFLIQENQPVPTEYELAFVTEQTPGSSATPLPASLIETIGVDSISSDFANPSRITLGLGTNIIRGEVGRDGTGTTLADGSDGGTDGDYFTITIPDGLVLTNITVNRYNQLQRGFMIYVEGDTFSPIVEQNNGIATDKEPLLNGQTAEFKNYSSFTRGINALAIDIQDLPNNGGDISADDFIFRVGNDNAPDAWADAPAPTSIDVLAGKGAGGSDRIVLEWADNVIQDEWLQVTVIANADTALPIDMLADSGVADTLVGVQFYYGNARYDSGLPVTQPAAEVTFTDAINAFLNQTLVNQAPITSPYDYNRDGTVDFTDAINAFLNQTAPETAVQLISPPGGATWLPGRDGPVELARLGALGNLQQ